MTAPPAWAVVPVKPFHLAKARLSPILTCSERARLAEVMLEDVLAALLGSGQCLAGVLVPTADPRAAAVARRFGLQVLFEPAPAGLNAAVAAAGEHLVRRAGASMVVIPGDLPQLTPDAIDRALALLVAPRSVGLVKAAGDGGTNLLACRPATVIPPRFGPRSFEAHRQAARAAGITPGILDSAALGHDLDRPEDLSSFLASGTDTRTHSYLAGLGMEERLPCLMSS